MRYDQLHLRFGSHIAKRVQVELSASEFSQVVCEQLTMFLDHRAEAAHREYQALLNNPFARDEMGAAHEQRVNELHRRWREAEDLAYLVSVAEDVSQTTQRRMANSKN